MGEICILSLLGLSTCRPSWIVFRPNRFAIAEIRLLRLASGGADAECFNRRIESYTRGSSWLKTRLAWRKTLMRLALLVYNQMVKIT